MQVTLNQDLASHIDVRLVLGKDVASEAALLTPPTGAGDEDRRALAAKEFTALRPTPVRAGAPRTGLLHCDGERAGARVVGMRAKGHAAPTAGEMFRTESY